MKRRDNIFTTVPSSKVSRNLFDLSHEAKVSGKFGFLYPVLLLDALPGDSIRDQMTAFVRFAPMLAPIMHRVDVTTHFFFVPMRLVTDVWEDFITGGQDGNSAPVLPYITPAGVDGFNDQYMRQGELWDYMGLPILEGASPATFSTEQISILPFKAYQKIWNDWYRDPNFDDELELSLELEGDVSGAPFCGDWLTIKRRGWQKDYFTSALASPQRGPSVLLPLSGVASASDIDYLDQALASTDMLFATDIPLEYEGDGINLERPITINDRPARIENIDNISFENASTTINDFRRAMAIQRWLENNSRGGARYVEQIESHFNTRVPDFRLQRAEYLGGGKQVVSISEVLATGGDELSGAPPVGDMAGHGISVGKSNRFTYRCQEHGYVIGILSVMPQTAYQQGIERLWSRRTKFDFAWPELARLGEQEIISKEVFYSFNVNDDDENVEIFGYTPRYSEYKFKNDRVCGEFRTTLAFWGLNRIFTDRPVLSSGFTTMYENGGNLESPEESYRRIFAVLDGTDYLWCQLFHRLTAKRPLPYFGVPSIS